MTQTGTVDPTNPDGYELNNDQWGFMYQHYPEYCGAPYQMMTWLYGQSLAHEEMYNKRPSNVEDGRKKENKEGDSNEFVLEPESKGLSDLNQGKSQKKKDTIAQQKLQEEAKKKKIEEIRKKKEAEGRVVDPSQIEVKP
jgi:hypothetical protein